MEGRQERKNREGLSVAIITYNEEKVIGRCLQSVSFADEVVVVDSGSDDTTLTIAQQYGARIFTRKWSGFGHQKQFAVNQCVNDWVLIVDSDEIIPETTAEKLFDILKNPDHNAYSFTRKNYFNNKVIKNGSWGSDTVVRLFNKNYCHVSDAEVHESVVYDSCGIVNFPIHHFPRRDISSFLEKANRYSSIWAIRNSSSHISITTAVAHSCWCFLFNYVFRFGFLDGSEGMIIAYGDMVDTFFKYAKAWELRQKKPGNELSDDDFRDQT